MGTNNDWHLRKELSIGTIVSLFILGTGSLAAYFDAKGQIAQNAKNLEGVPDRITRLEERLMSLQEQQAQVRSEIARAAQENRQADVETQAALQAIAVAIARIQADLDNADGR